jgi:carboxymethylenebutenolidase
VKSSKPSNRVVFLFHEWFGINDYIKREAEQLQNELGAVTVLVLYLYDGKIATTQQEAGRYTAAANEERIKSIIWGAIEYVVARAAIGTIGWFFGGGWSLQASLLAGKHAATCVMYYGMPEKHAEFLKTLIAPVHGIFSKRDGLPQGRRGIQKGDEGCREESACREF